MTTNQLHPELAAAYISAREADAGRIAKDLGSGILSHSADWTTFDLNDDLNDYEHNAIWRTTFVWESGRFEGHVYNVKNNR